MKILIAAALFALPVVAFANSHMEKKDAAMPAAAPGEAAMPASTPGEAAMPAATPGDPAMAAPMAAAPAALPKCSAKIQDSCDQSKTTEKNALSYYPAESRDAGNNKIAGMRAKPMPKPM